MPASPLVVKLVLFDLDGTLVHSAPDLATAANRMLQELGCAEQSEERIVGWIGNGMVRLVKRALTGEWNGEPEGELFERGLASFKAHYAATLSVRTRPFPGVVESLQTLASAGFVLGCATNKPAAFTEPLLAQLGLARYFGVVVSGDTVAARKPDPLPLLHACQLAGVSPARTVLVGDSANDVLGARAAGMHAVAVTYGYNQGRDVRELQPDVVVDSAAELPQYLRLHTTD
jgi:phosphoglycolate phosphatase